jgi:hypothetical protein
MTGKELEAAQEHSFQKETYGDSLDDLLIGCQIFQNAEAGSYFIAFQLRCRVHPGATWGAEAGVEKDYFFEERASFYPGVIYATNVISPDFNSRYLTCQV